MTIRRNKVLYDAVAVGTSNWIPLDTRREEDSPVRTLRVILEAGDTFVIEGIMKESKTIDKSFLDTLLVGDISTIDTYTASGIENITGNWTYIRATKTGTAGKGIVEGYI